jgi:outer membrane receptor protein involved in Fe transport
VFAIAGPELTWKGVRKTGGADYVGRYDAIFGGGTLLKLMYGYHLETSNTSGPGSTTPRSIDLTVTPNVTSGGFGGWENSHFTRNVYKGDFSHFVGAHELKAGGDFENIVATDDRFNSGAGQIIYKLIDTTTVPGTIYYRHRYYIDDLASGFNRADPATWQIAAPLTVKPQSKNYSIYGQDSFRIGAKFKVNAGLRWERQEIKARDGSTAADLKKNWAPRIGAIWDTNGDGRSKVYANWGRFYEAIPQDMNIRAFGGELSAFAYNFDPNPANYQPTTPPINAKGDPMWKNSILGASTEPVDPNLRGQYIDEFLAGYEREIAPNFSVAVKYAHRTLGRVIEDFLVPSEGNYFIANPAEGTLGQQMAFYDYTLPAVAAPKPVRKYDSVEFSANKRFSQGWQMLASYTWSKLEGNYDGTFQNSTGQLDPNINSAYDYADFLVNAQGNLSNDRRNAIKLDGSYEIQTGALERLNFGGSFHWFSGYPLNAYGYSFAYQNWEYYLVPRGSLGRGPKDYEVNAHVSYPIKLGGSTRLEAIMDVFNLLNRQAITQYDQRYNLVENGHCAGIPDAFCNGDGGIATSPGTLNVLGVLSNPRSTATNPDFLKAGNNFTGQRSIRIGARFTF